MATNLQIKGKVLAHKNQLHIFVNKNSINNINILIIAIIIILILIAILYTIKKYIEKKESKNKYEK